MPDGQARIAIVGAGLIGRRHIRSVVECPAARLACVVDPDPRAGGLAASHGVPHHGDLDEMLARGGIDGLVVATPNQLHLAHGLAAIGAGLPVLIEKPLADSAAGGEELVKAGAMAGVPILVGHHRRHNPIMQDARRRIRAGELGEIVAVNAMCWLPKPDDYFETHWRREPGAGPVLVNLIHDIDLLRFLIGEVASVQAIESNRVRGHAVEDTAIVLLRFTSGALATLSVSDAIVAPWSWEMTAAENPIYPLTGESCYLIGGARGSLQLPDTRLWFQDGQPDWTAPMHSTPAQIAPSDPIDRQMAHFCRVIAGEEAPIASGAEGLASLRVIEAIKQAAACGGVVHLDR